VFARAALLVVLPDFADFAGSAGDFPPFAPVRAAPLEDAGEVEDPPRFVFGAGALGTAAFELAVFLAAAGAAAFVLVAPAEEIFDPPFEEPLDVADFLPLGSAADALAPRLARRPAAPPAPLARLASAGELDSPPTARRAGIASTSAARGISTTWSVAPDSFSARSFRRPRAAWGIGTWSDSSL